MTASPQTGGADRRTRAHGQALSAPRVGSCRSMECRGRDRLAVWPVSPDAAVARATAARDQPHELARRGPRGRRLVDLGCDREERAPAQGATAAGRGRDPGRAAAHDQRLRLPRARRRANGGMVEAPTEDHQADQRRRHDTMDPARSAPDLRPASPLGVDRVIAERQLTCRHRRSVRGFPSQRPLARLGRGRGAMGRSRHEVGRRRARQSGEITNATVAIAIKVAYIRSWP